MPIYEYECRKCGTSFEALILGREEPVCEQCGSKRLKKLVSTFAAVGSGEAMPPCKGSSPSCARSVCDSGLCPAMRTS